MKVLMLSALLCALALTRAAESKNENKQIQEVDKEEQQIEKRLFWSCPKGWKKHNGRCYHYVPRPLNWADAEKNCHSMDGHLASIRKKEEYFWLQHMINSRVHGFPETWLGASTRNSDRHWFWSDGTKFTFSYWCKGEPSNSNYQQCLQMNYSTNKCWDDVQCSLLRPSVCVKVPTFWG